MLESDSTYQRKQRAENRQIIKIVGGLVAFVVVGTFVLYKLDPYMYDTTPSSNVAHVAPRGEVDCPDDFAHVNAKPGAVTTCWCDGPTADHGIATGTNQYDVYSTPCTAAIHAGAITSLSDPQRVTFRFIRGCRQYIGTRFNARKSYDGDNPFQPMNPSFIVVGHGTDSCSQSFNEPVPAEAPITAR